MRICWQTQCSVKTNQTASFGKCHNKLGPLDNKTGEENSWYFIDVLISCRLGVGRWLSGVGEHPLFSDCYGPSLCLPAIPGLDFPFQAEEPVCVPHLPGPDLCHWVRPWAVRQKVGDTHTHVHVAYFVTGQWSKQLPCHDAFLQPKATSLSPWPRVTSTLVFLSGSQPWSHGKTD